MGSGSSLFGSTHSQFIPPCTARGYAIVVALILLTLASFAASVAVLRSSNEAQRQRELELLFVGNQFREAIRAYAAASSGIPDYPRRLEDLVEDHRVPTLRRFLRRIYSDPMTGKPDWALIRQGDRIVGVHSTSMRAPQRRANFSQADSSFVGAKSYVDWQFSAAPSSGTTASLSGDPSGGQHTLTPEPLAAESALPTTNAPQDTSAPTAGTVLAPAPQQFLPVFSPSANGFGAAPFAATNSAETPNPAP